VSVISFEKYTLALFKQCFVTVDVCDLWISFIMIYISLRVQLQLL